MLKSIKKGQILCSLSNGVQAILLTDFKQAKVYFNYNVDTFSTEGMTVEELCTKLKKYE